MLKIATNLPEVFVLEPRVFADERGFFLESYNLAAFTELGIAAAFVQDNHSKSVRGALRGLHYQLRQPQAKLCRVVQGEVLDVAVDVRRGSPRFGQWAAARLSAENKREMFVPRGFAHGFVVLTETAEFLYKCDDVYNPADEYGIAWNDPTLGIDWNVTNPVLSAKDQELPVLHDVPIDCLPAYNTPL